MHRAIDQLNPAPQCLLIDGNRFRPFKNTPHHCMVKGDSRYTSIAAASVLAKTHRDEIMQQLNMEFPHYGWAKNKGYPTKDHRRAIAEFGPCIHHRKTFTLLR